MRIARVRCVDVGFSRSPATLKRNLVTNASLFEDFDIKPGGWFGPASSTDLAREWGYPAERLTTLSHGETAAVKDVRITSVRAHDPRAKGANGYLLEAEGVSLLHMGDSLHFPELGEEVGSPVNALFVSVGHNPKGKNYYMTESDAARAARDVRALTLVPMHWDLWRSFYLDPKRVGVVARWYCPNAVVKIPRYGRKMVLSGAQTPCTA